MEYNRGFKMSQTLKNELREAPKLGGKLKLKVLLFEPLVASIIGFLLFVTVIFFVKFLSYMLSFQPNIYFDKYDFYLSSLGLVLAFAIRLIDNLKKVNY